MTSSTTKSAVWCPEFSPTREEFSSFSRYIRTVVEPQCGTIGICKIIPPRGWFSRSYELATLPIGVVSKPVSQHVAGKKGIYNVDLVERKTMNASEYFDLTVAANVDHHGAPSDNMDPDAVERLFWKSLRPTMDAPVYGADIVASLFGEDSAMSWNLNHLDTILKCIDLPGVTRSMLYFGMWRSMFAFHTEDMDLYSINYLHTGKPKFWYAVPRSAASQVERAAQAMFPEKHHACSQFLRHKTSLISPARLKEFGVPYTKAFQKPGEFIITFPATYHQGFNLGFNIAEAVNFASLRWFPYGLKAKVCKCVHDSVRIDMDRFMMKLLEDAENNKDILGEDAWVFSCKCGKFTSSDEPSFIVEEQWFECSSCKIWAHVRCVHPEMSAIKEEELPSSILCHRCMAFGHIETHQSPSTDTVDTTSHSSSTRTECLTPTKPPRMRSLQPKRKLSTPEPSLSSTKKKQRFVKGSTIQFEDSEARVTDVDGKFMRLHYKGQSVQQDEWVPVNLKELQKRIIAVTPPPVRKLTASTSTIVT